VTETSLPPRLGVHTRAVLADLLGIDDAQADELAAAGAFGPV
jgi:crotonobetainyl-CoA:carnitine CoA-transferase CaiB-like acyl-CoA transferase